MNIGVYDLVMTQKYSLHTSVGSMDSSPVFDMPVRPLLVMPSDDESNRAPYLISRDHLILDDIVIAKDNASAVPVYEFDFRNVYSLDKMILGLIIHVESDDCETAPDCRDFQLSKNGKVDYLKYGEYLKYWFTAQNELITEQAYLNDKATTDASYTVIPIIERFGVDAQEYMIRANTTSGSKTALIWRSVAACIGVEEKLKAQGLHEGSIVYVYDFNNLSNTVSKITMHELDGRLIPGHHLYKKDKDGKVDPKNYPIDKFSIFNDSLNYDFPYGMDEHGLTFACNKDRSTYSGAVHLKEQAEFVIVIGHNVRDEQINLPVHPLFEDRIYRDPAGDCVTKGAARFANRMANHIVSYYDECEELSLAIITENEEVELKTLIPKSDKLTGGLAVKGKAIEGISLNTSNPVVDFYLLLGDKQKDAPLKVLSQELHATIKLINNAKSIPLVLHPSLIAGQGRAKVQVDTLKPEDSDLFQSVYLDWENMKDAIDTKNNMPITVEYLEENMERTFPVDIPTVRMNDQKFRTNFKYIVNYVKTHDRPYSAGLNQPWMPYRYTKKGVERFIRENIFGSPRSSKDLPSDPAERKMCEVFFNIMREEYINHPDNSKYLTPISWTYHSEYFPEVMESLRKKMRDISTCKKKVLLAQELSACSNMLEDDSDLVLFMQAFYARVHSSNAISQWLRVAAQIMMYNTTFLKRLSLDDIYNAMDDVYSYLPNAHSKITLNYVLSFFIFLLKIRRYNPGFCKPSSADPRDWKCYVRLSYLTEPLEKSVFKSIIRFKQCLILNGLDGKVYNEFLHLTPFKNRTECEHVIDEMSLSLFPIGVFGSHFYEFDSSDYTFFRTEIFNSLGISDGTEYVFANIIIAKQLSIYRQLKEISISAFPIATKSSTVYKVTDDDFDNYSENLFKAIGIGDSVKNQTARRKIFGDIVREKQGIYLHILESVKFHDLAYWYSSLRSDDYISRMSGIPEQMLPSNALSFVPYELISDDMVQYAYRLYRHLFISTVALGANSEWMVVLRDYLNGKGNLNLPIGSDNDF